MRNSDETVKLLSNKFLRLANIENHDGESIVSLIDVGMIKILNAKPAHNHGGYAITYFPLCGSVEKALPNTLKIDDGYVAVISYDAAEMFCKAILTDRFLKEVNEKFN